MIIDDINVREQAHQLTIKQLDPDDQPRERALKHGVGILSDADLLALILRVGVPGKPVTELCRDILRANGGSLHSLERRTRKELMSVKGIGTTKALQIEAIMEIVRRYTLEETREDVMVKSSSDIARVMRPQIGNLDHEEIWAIFLSRRLSVIRLCRVSQGGLTSSIFDVRIMMKQALLENADALALCHNHPSGNLNPSTSDDNITRICKEACNTMQINMIDHVIVSHSGHYSYADSGRL